MNIFHFLYNSLVVVSDYLGLYTYNLCFSVSAPFSCRADPVSCLTFLSMQVTSIPILPTGKVTLRQLLCKIKYPKVIVYFLFMEAPK